MEIIDINGATREMEKFEIVIDKIFDKDVGDFVDKEFIAATIVGKNRKGTWVEYYPLNTFKTMNPEIDL